MKKEQMETKAVVGDDLGLGALVTQRVNAGDWRVLGIAGGRNALFGALDWLTNDMDVTVTDETVVIVATRKPSPPLPG